MIINILGTEYELLRGNEEDYPKLNECTAYTEPWSKKIVVEREVKQQLMTVENSEAFLKKVTRHEIIHAFLTESGLLENSDWAENEEMVDWIAIQFPKLVAAFSKVGAI